MSATRYYQLQVTDADLAVATTNKVTITVGGTDGVFSGASNTDFNNAANWCSGSVPTSTTDVNIGSASNVSANITVKSLVIGSGGRLSFSNGAILTATNGITVQPGGMLIGSSANISGTVTLQRNINGQRGWRVLANPFGTEPPSFISIATNNNIKIETTGSLNTGLIADVRKHDNGTGTWSDAGTSTEINVPYALFIRGISSEVTGLTYSGGPSPFVYSVSGKLNGASVSITPASTSNLLIVGNPYAAPVNSQALTGGVSSPYYTYQVFQSSTQSEQRTKGGSWVAILPNSNTSNTVPVLGVVAYTPASNSSFNITTADINTGGTLVEARGFIDTTIQDIELLLSKSNGDYGDKLFVRFDGKSAPQGTERTDLKKFYNETVNLYTLASDNSHLAIDARANPDTIPLAIYAPAGSYKFSLGNVVLEDRSAVYLSDAYEKVEIDLTKQTEYPFVINTDALSKGDRRFKLYVGARNQSQQPATLPNAVFEVKVMGNVIQNDRVLLSISGLKNNNGLVRIQNMNGQVINTVSVRNGIQYVPLQGHAAGLYLLQITDGASVLTQKIIKQ